MSPRLRNNRPSDFKTLRLSSMVPTSDSTNPEMLFSWPSCPYRQAVEGLARQFDPTLTTDAQGTLLIDGGATEICLIRWEASDPPLPGLPNQQTLERLVCASLCAAYPQRGQNVQNWLTTRHSPPPESVKEYIFSHMAGWYAKRSCDEFYSYLWEDDPAIVAELKARLEASGAWQIAQTLANET